MKYKAIFSILLLLMAFSGFAQEYLPENFYFTKPHYGLDILVIKDKTVPLVTLELAVKNGSFTEPPEFDGLSHLYEHMFFKANQTYPTHEAYQERMKELGIVHNGTTTTERVNYYITLSNRKLKEGLEFMSAAIQHPLFLEEEMKRENHVVDAEFERNESNPFFHLRKAVDRIIWGKHFSHKNTIGNHEVIKNATPEMMQTIKDKYYHPNNSILIIAGDVEQREAISLAEKAFEDWKHPGVSPFVKNPVPEIVPIYHSVQLVVETPLAKAPSFLIRLMGPDYRHDIPGTWAADVFNYILLQKNSKLKVALIESGLALDVNVSYYTQRYIGPINISLTPSPDHIQEAYDTLMNHILRWNTDSYFTDEQLQSAKDLLAIQNTFGKEKTSEYAHTISFFWASTSLDYFSTYDHDIQQVTRDEIKRYINRYLIGRPYVSGLMISPEMRSNLQTDSFFTETYTPIESYNFHFNENSLNFSDSTSSPKIQSLIQWMKINPTVRIQLNGFADSKREMINIRNDEIREFTENLEDFKMFPKMFLGTQEKARLDFFRALKVIKILVENGIEIDRLQGSGRLLKGETKQDAAKNRKVVASMAQ